MSLCKTLPGPHLHQNKKGAILFWSINLFTRDVLRMDLSAFPEKARNDDEKQWCVDPEPGPPWIWIRINLFCLNPNPPLFFRPPEMNSAFGSVGGISNGRYQHISNNVVSSRPYYTPLKQALFSQNYGNSGSLFLSKNWKKMQKNLW